MARPTHVEARWRWPRRRCLCSCQGAGVPTGCRARWRAGSEGVEPLVVGVGDRDTAAARAHGGEFARDVVRECPEVSDERSDYARTTGLPALAASRSPGFHGVWSRERWHAYAPKLDRAWPWSLRSAVSTLAIGTSTLRPTTRQVNRVSRSVVPRRESTRRPQRAGRIVSRSSFRLQASRFDCWQ